MSSYTFVKSAKKDIYYRGKIVEYVSERGKNQGKTLSKIDRSIPYDKTDSIFIHKGESYYHWQFMYGSKNYSKTIPKPSQLTQSEFLSTVYEINERIEEFNCETQDEFNDFRDEIVSDLESLRDITQEKFDNMPDSLQSGTVGELLQSRIDELDTLISDIENTEVGENMDEQITEDEILIALEELQSYTYQGE